jgi:exopolyphosphatase/guanosine-5'-triphosphate,3'-diphosphate pyrophosphatase
VRGHAERFKVSQNGHDQGRHTQRGNAAAGDGSRLVAVIDMGASAIRLLVAEARAQGEVRVLEEAVRGVLLGKGTFTHGRLESGAIDATLRALEGFRRIMDSYGVVHYRAVATSAVREAQNRDTFLDRVRVRTGLEIEVVDGSEENRLTYVAVREALHGHEALTAGTALLVEVGGGSADISLLRGGEPAVSGTYALGAIRLRQSLASWHGSHEQRMRLLRRHVQHVVEDIRREMPLREARYFVALGGDVRFAAARLAKEGTEDEPRALGRDSFLAFCDQIAAADVDQLVDVERLPPAEAETLVPALLVYRELLSETDAAAILVSEASLRTGLLLDFIRAEEGHGIEDFGRQVLASAEALGEKYRFDAPHARHVARLSRRLFDDMRAEHGLTARHRLLLEVAALLHDIGNFVNLRAHHKHTQYLLSVAEIFGLSAEDMAVVSNIARYHRRALPQRTHLPYVALDRDERVAVDKLAALLRLANALDADHLQKVSDLHVRCDEDAWVLEIEGSGDLTIERLVALSRADLFSDVFGKRVTLREGGTRP